jgi:hypothetical protein
VFPEWFLLSRRWLAVCLVFAACVTSGLAQKARKRAIMPTTTLQAETGNNTSTADSFSAQGNGNAAAGNVSKVATNSLLYAGSTTQVFASWLPWFGGSNHMNVGYRSDDPAQVHRQVVDMMSRGIQGVIIDWFGPNVPILSDASLLMQKEVEAHPGFQFAIMEDSGALFNAAVANGCDVTSQLISDIHFINSQFTPSPAYMHINGRPVIFTFGITQFYIDWGRVLASIPTQNLLIFRGPEGFQQSFADGSFQWIDINTTDAFNPELAALDAFYTQAAQNPSRAAVGAAYKGFHDPLAMWGTNRQIHQRCGQTWIDTFAETGKFFSASHQLGALQLVTWNDYEEGSQIESGIDNCVFVVPSLSGSALNWTVGGGSESTIDHYTVFASTDGQNLEKLADVAAGQHGLDLGQSNLPSPVMLFVKAVGRPSIRNTMSAPVTMTGDHAAPHAVLNTSVVGDLTVQASTAGSSDSNGSIRETMIDFGDGAVLAGPVATHHYAQVGDFTVTATVVNNRGASAVAATRVEAKAAAPGVTILSPARSASVNWPTPIVASANSGSPISRMDVQIDGAPSFATDRGAVNSNLKVFVGTHHIVVQATDANGATSLAAVDVVGEPGDLPPTAVATVAPLPKVSANTVIACFAGSRDPDGFILQYKSMFSDGTQFFTPAAVHTLAAPGTYSVTIDVIDQFGAPASHTETFTVGGMSTLGATPQSIDLQSKPRQFEPIRRP